MLSTEKEEILIELEKRIVEVIKKEQYDIIEALSISATHGWINCLLTYRI